MYVCALTIVLVSSFLDQLGALGLGSLLLVLITFFHVSTLDAIVSRYRRKTQNLRDRIAHPLAASRYFGGTILLMLVLHLGDTCIWAFFLYGMKLVPNIHDAFYFTANTYTSLGYGDSPLSYSWRELSPLIAMSGLFTFACTTSQLFTVMGYHHDIVLELISKQKDRKAATE